MYVEDSDISWLSRLSVTCFLLILLWILWYCHRQKVNTYRGIDLPPGSLGLPVLGETISLARQKINFFRVRRQKFGDVYKTHLFFRPTVRVSGADKVRMILKGENTIVSAIAPKGVRSIMGVQSISQSQGKEHGYRKRGFMQGLTGGHLASYGPDVASYIQENLQEWSSQNSIELCRSTEQLTLGLVLSILYGRSISKEDLSSLGHHAEVMVENLFSVPINLPGTSYNKAMKARHQIEVLAQKMITKILGEGNSRLSPVLETMLNESGMSAERKITPSLLTKLTDCTVELIVAGRGTVFSTMANCILLLNEHPKVARKLREELAAHSVDDPKEVPLTNINLQQLQSLQYLDHIVKEVLRLRPAVGGGYRLAKESFEIDGYVIPKDWAVAFSIRETHEAQSIPRLTEFDPDRWQQDNPDRPDSHRFAYIPFGAGARSCPGKEFAKLVLKLTLLELTRAYEYSVLSEYKMAYFPTPKPDGEVQVKFVEQKKATSLGS